MGSCFGTQGASPQGTPSPVNPGGAGPGGRPGVIQVRWESTHKRTHSLPLSCILSFTCSFRLFFSNASIHSFVFFLSFICSMLLLSLIHLLFLFPSHALILSSTLVYSFFYSYSFFQLFFFLPFFPLFFFSLIHSLVFSLIQPFILFTTFVHSFFVIVIHALILFYVFPSFSFWFYSLIHLLINSFIQPLGFCPPHSFFHSN